VRFAACSEIIARRREPSPLTAAFLACFLLGGQVYLIAARGFANVLETPFLPYCLLGAFAIHMASRPGRFECILTLTLAGLLAVGFVGLRPGFRWTWPNSLAAASSSGLASLAVLTLQVLVRRGAGQREKLTTLIGGSIFIYTSLFIALILKWTAVWHPKTYDLYLYAADRGFGLPIVAMLGTFVARHAAFSWWCGLVYESLPLAVSLLYAYERGGSRPLAIRVLPVFLGGGAAAYLLYNILPAAGPLYIFGSQFPANLPAAVPLALQTPLMQSAPRNAVPSMHLACALLIFWNTRRFSRWVYAATGAYLGLTIAATLGFGEHYVVDLVAGVPYALFLGAAGARTSAPEVPSPARNRALWLGGILTLAWIGTLRLAPFLFTGIAFTWIAALGTVGICWAAQRDWEQAFARAAATRPPSSFPDPPPESPLPRDPAWASASAGSHYASADTPLLP
jgi:hypothetical protein